MAGAVLKRSEVVLLAIIAAVVVAVVAVVAYPRLSSVLPLTAISPVAYLPLVLREYRVPDSRFGVAEHTPWQAELLGLAGADYISGQWRLPLPGDTAVFLRPTERPHPSTWLLCSWSATNGWYDKEGCRQWIERNPGMDYITGNELSFQDGSIGDGFWVDAAGYARWYHDVWEFIKAADPTATIAPYGPAQHKGGLLIAVWDSYQEQFGELMPADFQPVHFYCEVTDAPWWCWRKLSNWVGWLERQRGIYWVGPQDYRLTEWGLKAWDEPVPQAVSLALMEEVIPWLKSNTLGITNHAWWPSCNSGWPDQCTLLIRGDQVTEPGHAYLKLALE